MAEYDFAQVQIRMIDLAYKITSDLHSMIPTSAPEKTIEERTRWFDQAYKAISKTVAGK